MLLITHIIVAVAGLVLAGLAYFVPSITKLRILAATTTFTLASGTVLVLQLHASLTSACVSGLFYLGVVLTSASFSYKKLAKVQTRS